MSLEVAPREESKRQRLSDTQRAIQERREEVFQLLLKNLTEKEIAAALNVSQATISGDVQFLQQQATKGLSDVIEKALPWQFEKCMRSLQQTSREAWILYHSTTDANVKLKCLREIRESEALTYALLRGGNGLLAMTRVRADLAALRSEAEEWKHGKRWLDEDNDSAEHGGDGYQSSPNSE